MPQYGSFVNQPGQFSSLPQMQPAKKGFDWGGIASGAATGAAAGGPIGALGGAAIAAIPSIFGAIRSVGQRRQAKRIRQSAVDPGYEMNSGVMENASTLRNRYGNYQIPGYNQSKNDINASGASMFSAGLQGASSGTDVLDLATKIAYGTGRQQRDLNTQNAQGREGAFQQFLGANEAAGEERQQKNQYEIQKYMQQLAEAAALYNASDQNMNSAITGASSIGTSALMNPKRNKPQTTLPN